MKTTMKSIKSIALLGLIILSATFSARADRVVIVMRDGNTYTYNTSQYNYVYVGGEYGTEEGVGVKIYANGSEESVDYLFSQMTSFTVEQSSVATPVISPSGGTIYTTTSVTITCETSGATIHYTTDGTDPDSSSPEYSSAISVSTSQTIKAIAIKNNEASNIATAVFTYSTDNNVNANWKSSYWETNKGSMSYTPKSAGFSRLEVPRIKDSANSSWVQKSTTSYGVTFALEWDNSKKSNRWTCYQMYKGNYGGSNTGSKNFKTDTDLPQDTRTVEDNYKNSGYSKGHLCPSADRKISTEQNNQTYFMDNMQPQWQKHNESQWGNLEGDVRTWAGRCDTLYVVKAATIDDVTINNITESGVFSTSYNGSTYSDLVCRGNTNASLPVPKYFYMALLAYDKSSNKYYAMGIWTKHFNAGTTGADQSTHNWPVINKSNAEYITIDELESRTGIDFFCNLPDDIENAVEATLNTTYWSSGASLNR